MAGAVQERRRSRFFERIAAVFARKPDSPKPAEAPEIDLYFADDSKQGNPTRAGMFDLVAIGGISVPVENARALSDALDALCAEVGFPVGGEFKWSPRRDQWMRAGLVEEARAAFFQRVLELLARHEVHAVVVIEDTNYRPATAGATPEVDLTRMFLERVEWEATQQGALAIVIADRPGGGTAQDASFLQSCLETVQAGTQYVKPKRIIHNVVSTPSHLSRLLQAADLIVGATLSFVSGETTYSPPVFAGIRPLLRSDGSRIGGVGLKIHPDFRYANLYHWLLGDTTFWKSNMGEPMPIANRPYANSADRP